QNGRLAGAVRADNSDLGARVERHGDVIEDDLVAHGLAGLLHGVNEFGHFRSSRSCSRTRTRLALRAAQSPDRVKRISSATPLYSLPDPHGWVSRHTSGRC